MNLSDSDDELNMEDLKAGVFPYDNDVTLLYKAVEQYGWPIDLIIVRPRKEGDENIPAGTTNLVFEPMTMAVERLINQGETPASIYDIIKRLKPTVDIDDIIMTYFNAIPGREQNPEALNIINELYLAMDNNLPENYVKFDRLDDFIFNYSGWLNQVQENINRDVERLDTILYIQKQLLKYDEKEKIKLSPVILNSAVTAFHPTLNGRAVNKDDGLDIFNHGVVSKYVPYIQYNDSYGKRYYRVYTGDKVEHAPNYSMTILPENKAKDVNTIYLTMWLGDPHNDGSVDVSRATQESFFTVAYDLVRNTLTVEVPIGVDPKKALIQDENIAYERAHNALPILFFGEGSEINVRGNFNIWGIYFDETTFLDMVLLSPIMNVYLYVEENMTPYAIKKRLDVHYRSIYSDIEEGKTGAANSYISNSASVSITLTPKIAETTEVIELYDPITKIVTQRDLEQNTPYIHINISQAESREVVEEFIKIFRLLMRYYLDNYQKLLLSYVKIVPELEHLGSYIAQRRKKTELPANEGTYISGSSINISKKSKANAQSVESRIRQLREQAPDLFISGYPRLCQKKWQPVIIDTSEINAWRQRRVPPTYNERQVLPFTKDNPRWFFVCPDDELPYPGVKQNTLANEDLYPYIPCCYGTDQMSPGMNSDYRTYISNQIVPTHEGAKAEKPIITRKMLSPGGFAIIPPNLKSILSNYSEDTVDLERYGIPHTPNSLLHCICVALDDPGYYANATKEARETYVSNYRTYLASNIHPSLLQQELYDYDEAEITELLRDNERFLDPSLVYRALEEVFSINIYTFTYAADTGILDIPRFKIFHSRPLRLHRPTVLIMKIEGSESNALKIPQCELIVDYNKPALQIMKLFGPEMTEICHSTLQETMSTFTCSVPPNEPLSVNVNIYYYIDHLSILRYPAVSQFIDQNGKLRALTLNVGSSQLLTIATLPSQPENLPLSPDIHLSDLETVINLFGQPTAVTRNLDGLVDGLWFQIMDIIYGEYIPIIPTAGLDDLQIGPPNPIVSVGTNVTLRMNKLRRTLNIITQLIRWLYELARSKQLIDPAIFVTNYMVFFDDVVEDSATFYDLSNAPRRLPVVNSIEQAIEVLTPLIPSLFHEGKILMYSQVFSQRMLGMLKDYSNLRYGMPPPVIEFINNYFESETDFMSVPYSRIFIGEKELKAWLTSLKSSQHYSHYYNIRQKIDLILSYKPDPFIYKDVEDGKIYIIQNVLGGSRAKALTVSHEWYFNKVNIGHDPASLIAEETVPYMIYGISPSSTLIPIFDNTGGQDNFLKLVYYGSYLELMTDYRALDENNLIHKEGRYAAMLDLL